MNITAILSDLALIALAISHIVGTKQIDLLHKRIDYLYDYIKVMNNIKRIDRDE